MNTRNSFSSINSKILLSVVSFSFLYPILLFGILPPFLPDNTAVKYALTIISALIMGALALWAMHKDNIEFGTIGFQKSKIYQAVLMLLFGWSIFAAIILSISIVAGENVASFLGEPWLIVQQWLFVGMGEELLFRGFLLTSLLNTFTRIPAKLRILLALFIGNGIFATFHIPVVLYKATEQDRIVEILSFIPAAFLVGLILSYFFLRTRNVLLAGLIHGSINAPLIGKQDDPTSLLILVIILVIINELWMFIQNRITVGLDYGDPGVHPP